MHFKKLRTTPNNIDKTSSALPQISLKLPQVIFWILFGFCFGSQICLPLRIILSLIMTMTMTKTVTMALTFTMTSTMSLHLNLDPDYDLHHNLGYDHDHDLNGLDLGFGLFLTLRFGKMCCLRLQDRICFVCRLSLRISLRPIN